MIDSAKLLWASFTEEYIYFVFLLKFLPELFGVVEVSLFFSSSESHTAKPSGLYDFSCYLASFYVVTEDFCNLTAGRKQLSDAPQTPSGSDITLQAEAGKTIG